MNKVIINEEHLEAAQAETNRQKQDILSKIQPKERRKLEIVKECVRKMDKAGIPFFLFPIIKGKQPIYGYKDTCWQYNSVDSILEFDKNGKPTKKSKEQVEIYFSLFISRILMTCFPDVLEEKGTKEAINHLSDLVFDCYNKTIAHMKRRISNKSRNRNRK